MKALIPILLFTFFTILLSCNADDISTQEDTMQSSDITTLITKVETIDHTDVGSSLGPSTSMTPQAIALEHTLQWISFTTASLIYSDTAARNYFLELVNYMPFTNYSDHTIAIYDLIGVDTPNTNAFKIAFRTHLIELVSQSYVTEGCPLGPTEAPEPPLDTGNGGNGSPIMPTSFEASRASTPSTSEIEEMVDAFLAYIIADECIEIYLPTGITSTFTEIISSAHPMNTGDTNNGYRIHTIQSCGFFHTISQDQGITPEYVYNAGGPIIIARPTKSRGCEYLSYPFDFTQFLN